MTSGGFPQLPLGSSLAHHPEFSGPEELVKVILVLRRIDEQRELEGCVSDAGLRRLLDLAFQTSLTTEEGRHPRFRLFVSARNPDDHAPPIARFDPPIPLRGDTLRRMVPAASSRLHALKVVEAA